MTAQDTALDALWGAGYDACMSGQSLEDNPYDPDTDAEAFAEWEAGWLDASRGGP